MTLPLGRDHAAFSACDHIRSGEEFGSELVALALPHQHFIPWLEGAAHAHALLGLVILLANHRVEFWVTRCDVRQSDAQRTAK